MKDDIIYNVLNVIRNNDLNSREISIERLESMAKYYHLSLKKKVKKIDLSIALDEFLLNKSGYANTIPKLYYALLI